MVEGTLDSTDAKQCALGFACGAVAPLLSSSAMLNSVGNGACLVEGSEAFQQGQKEQQQSAFKHAHQCAHNKLIQQAKDKQSPDVRAAHQCIKSKVKACFEPCLDGPLSQQSLCINKRQNSCGKEAVSACKPPPFHQPKDAARDAYSKAMTACGYHPSSPTLWDEIVGNAEVLGCNLAGERIVQKWMMEDVDRAAEKASTDALEDEAETQAAEKVSQLERRVAALETKLEEAERRARQEAKMKEAEREEAEREKAEREAEEEPEPEEPVGEDPVPVEEPPFEIPFPFEIPPVAFDAVAEAKWEKSKKSVLRGKGPLPSSNLTRLPEMQKVEAQVDRRIDQEYVKEAQRAASQAERQTAEDAHAKKEDLHVACLLVLFSFPIAISLVRNLDCWEHVRGGGAALADPLLCAEKSITV